MISSSLGRLLRATWPTTASPTCPTAARAAALSTRPFSGNAKTHQRRHSSSKTSRSADGVKVVSPSRLSQNGQQEQEAVPQRGRVARRRSKTASAPQVDDTFANLPTVPPTDHLHPHDINLSSFFSLHRPISITSSIPTPSSSFDKIFEPQPEGEANTSQQNRRNQWKLALQTLDSLHFQRGGAEALHSTSSNDGVIHLDSPPADTQAFNQVLSTTVPYQPPPVPEPGMPGFGPRQNRPPNDPQTPEQSSSYVAADLTPSHSQPKRKSFRATIKRKSWSTTIIVTEITDAHGQKQFTATNSPIIQIPVLGAGHMRAASIEEPTSTADIEEGDESRQIVRWRQPFMQRMWLRQQESLQRRRERDHGGMLLISVKRQRKLKMKKHKYKKLMRRTRNLRRKLGKD